MTPINPTTALCEAVERDSLADMVSACPAALRSAIGFEAVALGGGVVFACRAGGLVVNRAIGLETDAETLRRAAAIYRDRGIDRFFLHGYGGDELDRAASEAGLARYPRAWVKLLRGDGAPPPLSAELPIGPARSDEGEAAGEIFTAAFDLPPAFAPVIAALVDRPGWEVLVARDGGRVAGVGLLFFRDGVGHLAGGATAPAYRRLGVQGALIAGRLRRAIAVGCRFVASETGEDAPGDPQHSLRNMIRCGFEIVDRRANIAPPDLAWGHGRAAG